MLSKSARRVLTAFSVFVCQWLVWSAWQIFAPSIISANILTMLLDSVAIKGLVWVLPFVLISLLGKDEQKTEVRSELFKKPFPWFPCVVFLCLTTAFLYTVRLAAGLADTHAIFDPMFVVFSLSAGVIEEASFRGGLFRLQEQAIGVFPAAAINGVLFTIYHYPSLAFGGNWMQLVSWRAPLIFVMGVVFCLMFYKWRNLALNMTVHTVWDILSYLFCLAG